MRKPRRNSARTAPLLAAARRPIEALERRTMLTVFTVTNANDSGAGSLRDALNQSNNAAGIDTIAFNIPSTASHVIRPASALPDLWDPGIIDGTTQPGYTIGHVQVQIDGASAGSGATGIKMWGGSTIKGISMTGFGGGAIDMFNRGFGGNTVQASWIGVDLAGNAAGNNASGIGVWGTANNVIGGPNVADRNVLSASKGAMGVLLQGSGATNNLIQNNYIGTDPTGNLARGNAKNGVGIQDAPNNRVLDNLISGNVNDGIIILNANATGNVVQGNNVGLNAAGTGALGNQWYGIEVQSANNTIGGTTAAQRNIFSANGQSGVVLFVGGATGNAIQGNYIGTDVTGNVDLGNAFQGIAISGANGNSIKGNLISGNNAEGVGVFPGNNNTIQGNTIGLAANGAPMRNSTWAITLINGSTGNVVGGSAAGQANVIFNGHNNPNIYDGGGNSVGANTFTAGGTQTSVPGSFTFSASSYAAAENAGTVTITVNRTASTNVAASVNYATANGTAASGSDYTAASGTLNFAAGETAKTFVITLLNDSNVEADETVSLTLSAPTGGATLGSPSTSTLTITNDDATVAGSFALSATTYSAAENAGQATITVTRTAGTNVAASVNYATSNGTASSGSDYTAASGTLTFAAGETSKTFTIPLLNDATPEADETFAIALSSPTGGSTLGSPSTATLKITNDDATVAGSFSLNASSYTVNENQGSITVTVVRSVGTNVPASVTYGTANGTAVAGSDYTAASGTLSFAAGETSKTFVVTITNDTLVESNETVSLSLSAPTGGATLGTPASATLTIVSDDVPPPDTTAPAIRSAAFVFDAAQHQLKYTFSEDVSATLSSADLYVADTTTYQSYTPTGLTYDRQSNVATFTFAGALPKGVYKAYLFGDGVTDAAGNKLDGDGDGLAGGNSAFNFFYLPGDANGDGRVDFTDLVVVSQSYGQRGQGWVSGDFNQDGTVDFADLVAVSQNYDTALNIGAVNAAVPAPAAVLAAAKPESATVTSVTMPGKPSPVKRPPTFSSRRI